jgi:hypothetical protein
MARIANSSKLTARRAVGEDRASRLTCNAAHRHCDPRGTRKGRHNSPMHRTRRRFPARRPSRLASRDAVRRATGAQRRRAGDWSSVGRLRSECFKHLISAVGTSAHSSSLPQLVGTSARSALGLMRRRDSWPESRPAGSAFLASIHESQPPRAAPQSRTAPVVRDRPCCAFAASHEQRSQERRNLPPARRFCQSVVRLGIKIGALGTAEYP